VDNVTLCLIKQNTMYIYGAMDYVAHILNFSSRWCLASYQSSFIPGREPTHIIHWKDSPEGWSGCGEQRNPFPLQ